MDRRSPDGSESRPRLRWRRTWADGAGEPDDFVASDPEHPRMHARIYLSRSGAPVGGAWIWAVGEKASLGTGVAATAREAALAAEDAWFAYRDREDRAAQPSD